MYACRILTSGHYYKAVHIENDYDLRIHRDTVKKFENFVHVDAEFTSHRKCQVLSTLNSL